MLRLVHPPPPVGQGTDPPARLRRRGARSLSLLFSVEEVRHIRAAITNAARAYGGMDVLASAMGVPVDSLYQARRRCRPSGILTIRLAAAVGSPVEAMIAGKLEVAAREPGRSRGGAS